MHVGEPGAREETTEIGDEVARMQNHVLGVEVVGDDSVLVGGVHCMEDGFESHVGMGRKRHTEEARGGSREDGGCGASPEEAGAEADCSEVVELDFDGCVVSKLNCCE